MKRTITKKELSDLFSENPKVKYPRAKALARIAMKNPKRLSPHLEFFITLLDSENNILKWNTIDIIGHLAKCAKDKHIDRLLGMLYGFLTCGKLITVNHAIGALANIAQSKPALQKEIIRELLKVEHNSFDTEECRNIALGKVVLALGVLSSDLKPEDEVLSFTERQTSNSRTATKRKAESVLRGMKNRHTNGHRKRLDQSK